MSEIPASKKPIFSDTETAIAMIAGATVGMALVNFWAGLAVAGVVLLFIHYWKLGYVGAGIVALWTMGMARVRKAMVANTAVMGAYDLCLGRNIDTQKFLIRSLDAIGSMGVYSLTRFGKTHLFHGLLHQIITRLRPEHVKVAIVDPEEFDYRIWSRIPHLLYPIARTEDDAVRLVKLISDEMERRGHLFAAMPRQYLCTSVQRYHQLIDQLGLDLPKLPRIVFLIDEMDLFSKKGSELESILLHLAKRGQKRGVFLWAATQRPSADIMNSGIRAEFTTRLVGHMESTGDYYRIHSIDQAVWKRMEPRKGRFMCYNEGVWSLIDGANVPTDVMEAAAEKISTGRYAPEWEDEPEIIRTRRPWQGSNDEKWVMVAEWMNTLHQKPTPDEFMAEFDVRSSNTASTWIEKVWNSR